MIASGGNNEAQCRVDEASGSQHVSPSCEAGIQCLKEVSGGESVIYGHFVYTTTVPRSIHERLLF